MDTLELQIFKTIVEHSIDTVIIIDMDGNIVFWNDSAEQLFGYSREEVMGRYVHDFLPPPNLKDEAHQAFTEFKKNRTGPLIGQLIHVQAKTKSGEIIDVQFGLNTVAINDRQYAYAFLRDISDTIKYQKQLTVLSETDELTGLLNRRAFNQQFDAAFSDAKRNDGQLCILILDLDHFKVINDQYGHDFGDKALQVFSKNVSTLVRENDFFGRLGGEEFCLILHHQPVDIVKQVAQRIVDYIATTEISVSEQVSINITVSIGLTMYQNADELPEAMFKRADKALYKAKHSGRNRYEIL